LLVVVSSVAKIIGSFCDKRLKLLAYFNGGM